jgi:hypothetical protein
MNSWGHLEDGKHDGTAVERAGDRFPSGRDEPIMPDHTTRNFRSLLESMRTSGPSPETQPEEKPPIRVAALARSYAFLSQNRNSTSGLAFAFESLTTVDHYGRRNSSTSERNARARICRRHASQWTTIYRLSRRPLPAGSTDNHGFFAALALPQSGSLTRRQYLPRSKRPSRLRPWVVHPERTASLRR